MKNIKPINDLKNLETEQGHAQKVLADVEFIATEMKRAANCENISEEVCVVAAESIIYNNLEEINAIALKQNDPQYNELVNRKIDSIISNVECFKIPEIPQE